MHDSHKLPAPRAHERTPVPALPALLEHAVRAADAGTLAMLGFGRMGNAKLIEIVRHFAMLGESPTRPGKAGA